MNIEVFVLNPIEASLYIIPEDYGLSLGEIVEIGKNFELYEGELRDTVNLLSRTSKIAETSNNRYILAEAPWEFVHGFILSPEPDYRNHKAFELILSELRLNGRKFGIKNCKLPFDTIASLAVERNIKMKDLLVAKHILMLCQIIKYQKDGVVELIKTTWPLPSEQFAHGVSATKHARPHMDSIFNLVRTILAERATIAEPEINSDAKDKSMPIIPNSDLSIFVSHSSSDKELVDAFVELIHSGCDVPMKNFFCTSTQGAGVTTGAQFIDVICSKLKKANIVILLLTPNYYKSNFCIAEMGAAWAIGSKVFPLILPGIPRNPGCVLAGMQTASLDQSGLSELYDLIVKLGHTSAGTGRWARKLSEFLTKYNELPSDLH